MIKPLLKLPLCCVNSKDFLIHGYVVKIVREATFAQATHTVYGNKPLRGQALLMYLLLYIFPSCLAHIICVAKIEQYLE